jgi:hypothetical protein
MLMIISTEMMKNVAVRTTDDTSGKIEQFYFDNKSWVIRYIVIVSGPLLSKEKKLLSPVAVQSIGPEGLRFGKEKWVLRYIIVESGSFLSSKKIILASQWSQKIEWRTNRIYFDINPTIIEQGPQYNSEMKISRKYESRLFDYYHKPYYR